MKKILILLLAALMIVGLGVSCKEDSKPVASEKQAENVTIATLGSMLSIGEYAYEIADGADPDTVKAVMDPILKAEYESLFEKTVTVTSVVTTNSLSVDIVDEDNINEFKVETTKLSYSDTDDIVSGSFKLYVTGRDEGTTISIDASGDFAVSFTKVGVSTITYSFVKYNGTEYDLAAFNDAMKKLLENWPEFTAIGNWEVTIEGPITLSLTVTEDAFSLIMTEGGAQVGTATGTWVPDSLFTGVVTVTTSTGYATAAFTPGEEVAFYADDENLTIKGYTFDRVDE